MSEYYVYILSSRSSTLYIGVTNDLIKRIYEHKEKFVEGFTKRYAIDRLVYYESGGSIESAIAREKQLKGWRRERKLALIESVNPDWQDLSLAFMSLVNDMLKNDKPVIKRGTPILYSRHGDSSLRSERQSKRHFIQ
jgi:putative endonuclease